MKISDTDIQRQLEAGEDSLWEFKHVIFAGDEPEEPKRDQLADEVAAFANTHGGVILCSVTDDHEVKDMTVGQIKQLGKLFAEICNDSIKPPVLHIARKLKLDTGQLVLAVSIPPGDTLHKSPGGCYQRSGDTKRQLGLEEQFSLAQRRCQARFLGFDSQPVPDTGFETLDERIWKPLLSSEGARDPQTALRKLRLLAEDQSGRLTATVAGVLLCAHNPNEWLPHATISAVRYRGSDRATGQSDATEISGPLDEQIRKVMKFVRENMKVSARKMPDRVDMPEYSLKAVFEAVVNAVVHRDYSVSARRIRLSMFSDRMEISSPGELNNGWTVDDMSRYQFTRNEAIAGIFSLMESTGTLGAEGRRFFMERRGDGVRTILRQTEELCGKKPFYESPDGKELFLTIPAALHKEDPKTAMVNVSSEGNPPPNADLLALYPDKTRVQATVESDGTARVSLYTAELPMRVFVAAPGKRAHCEEKWIPANGPLQVELQPLPRGGSTIFPERDGYIAGLSGRLVPLRELDDRTYLYANDMAINEGKPQPVAFHLGEELKISDRSGSEMTVRIVDIMGQSALIEYWRTPKTPEES